MLALLVVLDQCGKPIWIEKKSLQKANGNGNLAILVRAQNGQDVLSVAVRLDALFAKLVATGQAKLVRHFVKTNATFVVMVAAFIVAICAFEIGFEIVVKELEGEIHRHDWTLDVALGGCFCRIHGGWMFCFVRLTACW